MFKQEIKMKNLLFILSLLLSSNLLGQYKITSVSELNVNIKVIPNPANEEAFVYIEAKDNLLLAVSLFDESGKLVHFYSYASQQNSSAHTINVSDLSSGIYFMKVNSEQSGNYYKLIIAH